MFFVDNWIFTWITGIWHVCYAGKSDVFFWNLDFYLAKRQKIMKIHTKWLQDGSWELFGAQKVKKSNCFKTMVASWTAIWPVWEGALGHQGSPWEAREPTKGVQTPSWEVKSQSGKLQNDICMRISAPGLHFYVFFDSGTSKLQRNWWNNYRKKALKTNRRLCQHRSADMHNMS